MADDLILVNERNRAVGRGEKREVHEAGWLHRAFSIFLVDQAGQLLLQQRHPSKYHSGGLWANSCCGHPHPSEKTLRAAQRRLGEELGVICPLHFGFITRYGTEFPDGLKENEIVYVYFGIVPMEVTPNPTEISAVAFSGLADLKTKINRSPEAYTFWLKYYIAHHFQQIDDGMNIVLQRAQGVRNNPPATHLRATARSFA